MSLPKLPPLSGASDRERKNLPNTSLSSMPVEDLLRLRAQIDERLPARALRDIDLEKELVLQLLTSQRLQQDVLTDDEIAANQRAQVANSTAAVLAQLAKLQNEVYTSERLKQIEQLTIDALQHLPLDVQNQWLHAYERMAAERGL